MKYYFVYIATNKKRGTLYIGITNNIERRTFEHKTKQSNFTRKYNLDKIVYVEYYQIAADAIQREKQLKCWHRQWKVHLIEEHNPDWNDLTYE